MKQLVLIASLFVLNSLAYAQTPPFKEQRFIIIEAEGDMAWTWLNNATEKLTLEESVKWRNSLNKNKLIIKIDTQTGNSWLLKAIAPKDRNDIAYYWVKIETPNFADEK